MDKRIIWTDQVYRDIDSSADYIAKDSEYYAASFINAVLTAGKSLKTSAKRGRVVPEINDPDIREIFVKNHSFSSFSPFHFHIFFQGKLCRKSGL